MLSENNLLRMADLHNELGVALIVISLADGKLLYFNQRVCDDLGLSPKKVKDKSYKEIFWPEFVNDYETLQKRCEDGREHTFIYYWAEKTIWEQIAGRNIMWLNKEPALLLTITNITKVARAEYEYKRMALFDNLLELPNGQKLEEDINELANLETVALLYFEVERLEDINELYGWDVGDYLLLSIRDWLLQSETRRAQLYRVNNGFAVLGRGVTLQDAKARAQKILDRFNQTWVIPSLGRGFSIFCSIKLGIVFGKYVKNEMRNLLLRTIRTTNSSKGYALYDEATDRAAKNLLQLRETLINCVLNGMTGFEVYYQPIVEAETLRWAGLEALCRWRTPEGMPIPSLQVIHLAEQLGLIDMVDSWVRRTAMSNCVELGLIEKDFYLDVNFSPSQKLDDAFIKNLMKILGETGFPPERLNLEITESAKMEFNEVNLHGLKKLKETGISLSLDDFGTGYSSFENLMKIAASFLKTERLFLENIEQDSYRQYLFKVLIDTAHHLNMSLVAEGVETESQLKVAQQYGADYLQGYLFSRPMPLRKLKNELWRFS